MVMKRFLFTALILGLGFGLQAQIANPVKIHPTVTKTGDKEFELRITANIDPTWHLYAQDAGEGPEPTTIAFSKNPLVTLQGKVREEGKMEQEFDPNFNSVLKFYSNKVDFVQKVKVRSSASTVVKGTITYMVCNDKKCLPPKEVPFSFKLQGK